MSETITELAALRATVERIRAALDWVPERPTADVEAAIAADLHAGLSLRACAKKYAVTFGRVRGIKARMATRIVELDHSTPTDPMKELCEAAEEVQAAYEEWIDALPDSEAERGASVRIDFAHIGLRSALENAKGGGR